MRHIAALRPDFVKLDRGFSSGVDHDEAKAALVEALGNFTSRIDAWVIAEGIETGEELAALIRLGVPLGQGYFLGRPSDGWARLPASLATSIRRRASGRTRRQTVVRVVEDAPAVPIEGGQESVRRLFRARPHLEVVVLLDRWQRPVAVATDEDVEPQPVTRVAPDALLGAVAKRAITRERGERFAPLVCTDDLGRYVGILRIDRLLDELANVRS